jgi:ABC-type multidrug transport system fused ATPase/permease subunit/CRP-like cAMP-binding protein
MQAEIFARLQALPDSWVSRHSQGDVLSRMMNDVGRVQGGLATAIDGGIFQVVSLIVSTIIMLRVNVPLGLIVLVVAPIVAIVYRLMSSGARSRSIAVQEDSSSLMQVASENYQANAVVKLFRLAGHEQGRFARTGDRLFKSQMRLSLFGGLFGVAVNGIVTILRLIVLGFGTWLVFEGHFTVGGLVAFLGIMGEVLSPVTGLTTLGQTIQSSMGALVRIDEILDAPTEPTGAELPALAPIRREITLENVALSYSAERRALDGVDVQIPAGSRVAFVGPSGSGKSTVLRVLMRLYEPDEGTLRVDGVDVATRSLESLRAQMGVVFQDSFLFDATVRENIGFGKIGATEAEILAAAKAAEVDSFIDHLARGYDTMVGEGGRHLSGGQRQRVAIARALVGNPSILLLDEATSALDPKTERQIIDTLKKAGEGRTVVAITHRLTSIIDYDRIVMIVEGKVVETGTHEELVRLGGAYARQWAEQTGEAMPRAPAFDAAAALRRIALFRALSDSEIAEVIDRLHERSVRAGEIVPEGGDRVVIIRSGRAEILGSTISGERVVVRSVGAGEVFGLSALLGTPTGAQLRATEPVVALELDGDDVTALTRRHPTIAEARAGRGTLHGPATGIRLTSARAAGTSAGTSLTAADIRAAAAASSASHLTDASNRG